VRSPAFALVCSLLVAPACSTKKPSGEATPGSSAPPPSAPGGGEASGNEELTLEQATAGLSGDGKLMAEIQTDLGSIRCELFPDKAPVTVASFVGLARGLRPHLDPASGTWKRTAFFDGLTFHRVIPSFMIQGGDPLTRDPDHPAAGTSGPGYTLPDELAPDLKFDRPGRLAMANKGPRTGSAGSQFFITEVPYPSLDGGYAIFGQCQDPEVVKAITRVPKKGGDRPAEPVRMKVRIYRS
jgi:peptidyl-prolyl cis-trans isomerase A (cyclophilin A)